MGKEHAEMESLPRVAATVEFARFHVGSTLVLFFASGFAGLVYEVLWMKELGRYCQIELVTDRMVQ